MTETERAVSAFEGAVNAALSIGWWRGFKSGVLVGAGLVALLGIVLMQGK